MKYCSKCGNPMDDDMMFCQKCGTKFTDASRESLVKDAATILNASIPNPAPIPQPTPPVVQKPRRFLKAIATFCLFGAAVMLLMSLAVESTMMIGAFVYGIFGVMFLMLSKTPKGSTYLFGKDKGIKKGLFIWICIFAVFASVIIFASNLCNHEYTLTETKAATCTENGKETYICDLCEHKKTETIKATGHTMDGDKCTICGYVETKENNSQNNNNGNNENTGKPTMKDIEAWYVADISNVGKALAEYAPTKVSGLSDFKVTEGKFFFGNNDGWVDLNYTVYFTCKVNGVKCTGEARAFREYKSDSVYWFHFEIVKDSDWSVIIEEYDDGCDAMMEKHYAELEALTK